MKRDPRRAGNSGDNLDLRQVSGREINTEEVDALTVRCVRADIRQNRRGSLFRPGWYPLGRSGSRGQGRRPLQQSATRDSAHGIVSRLQSFRVHWNPPCEPAIRNPAIGETTGRLPTHETYRLRIKA